MVKINRWISLAAGCVVQASSGLNYSFSIVAPLFKARFNYSDMQLATLAVAINIGGYAAFLSGYSYDMLNTRHNLGPRVVIWVGCVLSAIGYGAMWAQVTGSMVESYSRMLLYAVVAGNASTWWDTSALVTNVRNFPDDRGTVMGILKAFVGMSTSIYASMYLGLFATPAPPLAHAKLGPAHQTAPHLPSTGRMLPAMTGLPAKGGMDGLVAFLGVLAVVPACLNLVGSLFINHVPIDYHEPSLDSPLAGAPETGTTHVAQHPQPQPPEASGNDHAPGVTPVNKTRRLTGLYVLVAVVAVLQAGSTLASQGQPAGSHHDRVHAYILLALLGLILLVPISTGPMARPSLRKHRRRNTDADGLTAGQDSSTSHADRHPQGRMSQDGEHGRAQYAVGREAETPLLAEQGQGRHSHTGSMDGSSVISLYSCSGAVDEENEAPPFKNLTPGQAMQTGTFWALFAMFLTACACGLTLLNNLGPLVLALGGVQGGQVAFVSLFSVANAAGRLLFGHFSEMWLHKSGLPRTVFLLLAASLMTLCMAVLALGAPLPLLYVLSLSTGFAFGGHWSSIPAVASDLFGLGSFAGIYSILQLASAVGAVVFASWLCGQQLEMETRRQGGDYCVGLTCFGPTWQVLLALQIAALVVGLWLWQATRKTYRQSVRTVSSKQDKT